uniref:Ubiquinol-cytochrome c reductase complex assembly factor 5 n=1 Tax=Lates calcarifer TaxID=8187 RepID=A0A4W6E4I1_LATCA
MFHKSENLKYLLSLVPGKRRFGTYRFLPIFFCIGGVMEWIMINVRIGRETFCEKYGKTERQMKNRQ